MMFSLGGGGLGGGCIFLFGWVLFCIVFSIFFFFSQESLCATYKKEKKNNWLIENELKKLCF